MLPIQSRPSRSRCSALMLPVGAPDIRPEAIESSRAIAHQAGDVEAEPQRAAPILRERRQPAVDPPQRRQAVIVGEDTPLAGRAGPPRHAADRRGRPDVALAILECAEDAVLRQTRGGVVADICRSRRQILHRSRGAPSIQTGRGRNPPLTGAIEQSAAGHPRTRHVRRESSGLADTNRAPSNWLI